MTEFEEPKSSALVDAAGAVAISLLPVIGSTLLTVITTIQSNQQQKALETLKAIVEGLTPEQIEERLGSDPAVQSLFVNGLDYAMRTRLDQKRRLLAAAVHQAIVDDARVDEAQLVIDTLGQLDAPHVQALARTRQVLYDAPQGWERDMPSTIAVENDMSAAWQSVPEAVRAALVRTGCSKPPTNVRVMTVGVLYGGPTEFGLQLLAKLDQVKVDEPL